MWFQKGRGRLLVLGRDMECGGLSDCLWECFENHGASLFGETIYSVEGAVARNIMAVLGSRKCITPEQVVLAWSILTERDYLLEGHQAGDFLKMIYVAHTDVRLTVGLHEADEEVAFVKTVGRDTQAYYPRFSGRFIGEQGRNRYKVQRILSEFIGHPHQFSIRTA